MDVQWTSVERRVPTGCIPLCCNATYDRENKENTWIKSPFVGTNHNPIPNPNPMWERVPLWYWEWVPLWYWERVPLWYWERVPLWYELKMDFWFKYFPDIAISTVKLWLFRIVHRPHWPFTANSYLTLPVTPNSNTGLKDWHSSFNYAFTRDTTKI